MSLLALHRQLQPSIFCQVLADVFRNVRFRPIADIHARLQKAIMAIDDLHGEAVLSGTWLYDGRTRERITIIARNYDMRHSMYEADGMLEDDERPVPLGPDGRLYYVAGSPPLPDVQTAKDWADQQPWGPVQWDNA